MLSEPFKRQTVKCLYPGCDLMTGFGHSGSRGLCAPHYNAARRLVEKGEATWPELEVLGMSEPSIGQTPRLDPIREVLKKKRKAAQRKEKKKKG